MKSGVSNCSRFFMSYFYQKFLKLPFSKSFLKLRDQSVYYEMNIIDSALPTLVFLHDSLGCVQLWRDFPSTLSEMTQLNYLVYDRIGYGKSDKMSSTVRGLDYMEIEADVLVELLEHLDVERPILFGHSDGGSIALIAAGKYPARIEKVIVEAAHIFVEEITRQGIRDAKKLYDESDLKIKLEKYHGENVPFLFKAWTDVWLSDFFWKWNIEHFLPSITAPLLFIQGDQDEYGTLDQVEKTISKVAGPVQIEIFKGIGHTPHKQSPVETLSVAASWLNAR